MSNIPASREPRKTLADFELVDHGIENEQYFPGCGACHTPYTDVATGIGNNPAEAIDDCLEQIACNGVDVEGMEKRILAVIGKRKMPRTPRVKASAEECHYYVSIRYTLAPDHSQPFSPPASFNAHGQEG